MASRHLRGAFVTAASVTLLNTADRKALTAQPLANARAVDSTLVRGQRAAASQRSRPRGCACPQGLTQQI